LPLSSFGHEFIDQTPRVFSASYDAQTSTLLALPAWRINAHEPAATVRADIKRHNDHRM